MDFLKAFSFPATFTEDNNILKHHRQNLLTLLTLSIEAPVALWFPAEGWCERQVPLSLCCCKQLPVNTVPCVSVQIVQLCKLGSYRPRVNVDILWWDLVVIPKQIYHQGWGQVRNKYRMREDLKGRKRCDVGDKISAHETGEVRQVCVCGCVCACVRALSTMSKDPRWNRFIYHSLNRVDPQSNLWDISFSFSLSLNDFGICLHLDLFQPGCHNWDLLRSDSSTPTAFSNPNMSLLSRPLD